MRRALEDFAWTVGLPFVVIMVPLLVVAVVVWLVVRVLRSGSL